MNNRKPLIFTSIIIVCSFFLVQCSLRKVGLQYGDFFISQYVDDLFDLDSNQEDMIDRKIDQKWRAFRAEKLPLLVEDLKTLSTKWQKHFTEEDLAWIKTRLDFWTLDLSRWLADDAADLFLSLKPEQFKHWQKQRQEKNEDWLEKLKKSDKDFEEEQIEKYVENFETWFGDIEKWQTKPLLVIFPPTKENFQEFYDLREQRFAKYYEKITNSKSKKEIADLFVAFLAQPHQFLPKDLGEAFKNRRIKWLSKIKAIDGHISSRQRTKAINYLNGIIADLESIQIVSNK